MTLNEKLNSMSNNDLLVVWNSMDNVDFTKQPDLYGVSFDIWAMSVESELRKRNLI
ncbi:MAG: hypothetical protein ACOCRK_10370 [bacterium]